LRKETFTMLAGTNPLSDGSGHALIIGGSMAGLLAARVLSERFGRVTIVERDRFPKGPGFRKGVPQSRHLHAFMMRGRQIAERLFPGLSEELEEAGAVLIDSADDFEWLTPAGFAPRFNSGLPLLMSSRDLLEWAVRERVAALPQVRFLQKTDLTGLLPTPDGKGVAAVKVRSRDGRGGTGSEEPLYGDLVVDASGRNSNASRWLEALGYAPPEETYINSRLGYASRVYRRPKRFAGDWKGLNVQAAPPSVTRGGVLLPLEGDRWMVTLSGLGGDYPPTNEAGFMGFARSLRSPILYEAIKDAEPISAISGYRDTENRRRHYEKLSRQPDNLLVTGDAACAFNPIYAQGMTTAALGAEVLEECLRESGDLTGLSKRFQKKLSEANAASWLLATGEDFRVRGVEGGTATFATRLTHRYMDRVLALSLRDIGVRRTFLEVFHMLKPPTALFAPGIAAKALRGAVRRATEEKPTVGRRLPEAA
jgi:2-polyprenyl-6-methoxyphenol hydroxylase-like FAD-dependent oxidoreductase